MGVNFERKILSCKNRPLLKGVRHLGKQIGINTSSFHTLIVKMSEKHEGVPNNLKSCPLNHRGKIPGRNFFLPKVLPYLFGYNPGPGC